MCGPSQPTGPADEVMEVLKDEGNDRLRVGNVFDISGGSVEGDIAWVRPKGVSCRKQR